MNRIIQPIERQLQQQAKAAVVERRNANLVAEWQQRGPETLSGHAVPKLRLTFAPPQSVVTASAARLGKQP